MALTSGTKAVTSTAAKIELSTGSASAKRTTLVIHSPSGAAATVYLGGSNVSSSNGFPLAAGATVTFTNDGPNGMHASQDWYGISSSSVTLQVTEGQ